MKIKINWGEVLKQQDPPPDETILCPICGEDVPGWRFTGWGDNEDETALVCSFCKYGLNNPGSGWLKKGSWEHITYALTDAFREASVAIWNLEKESAGKRILRPRHRS